MTDYHTDQYGLLLDHDWRDEEARAEFVRPSGEWTLRAYTPSRGVNGFPDLTIDRQPRLPVGGVAAEGSVALRIRVRAVEGDGWETADELRLLHCLITDVLCWYKSGGESALLAQADAARSERDRAAEERAAVFNAARATDPAYGLDFGRAIALRLREECRLGLDPTFVAHRRAPVTDYPTTIAPKRRSGGRVVFGTSRDVGQVSFSEVVQLIATSSNTRSLYHDDPRPLSAVYGAGPS